MTPLSIFGLPESLKHLQTLSEAQLRIPAGEVVMMLRWDMVRLNEHLQTTYLRSIGLLCAT